LAHALDATLEQVARSPEVHVVVVRGAGRSFCSGIDRDMVASGAVPHGFFALTERSRLALETMDKIAIAVVHGHCLGGGLQLAIACDIRIAVDDARLALPAITDGLSPGLAPIRLPRLIGLGPARSLQLTGEIIDAHEALRLGLVDHVVPSTDREAATRDLVNRYLHIPRTAAVAVKQLLARAFDPPA
jgi:enoyl-CoA hydratase/carnithine racemase